MRSTGAAIALIAAVAAILALPACATAPRPVSATAAGIGPSAAATRHGRSGQPGASQLIGRLRASQLRASQLRASQPGAGQPGSHPGRPHRAAGPAAPATGPAGSSPASQLLISTAHPNHVIGNGTAASCTSAAVVQAVAEGGIITFSCGPAPVTITMLATAKVRNTVRWVVLDGGGKVTLSGGGMRRILYLDTCDPAQVWTTSHCQDQSTPQLIVQNLTLTGGNSSGQDFDGGGGGAIFDRGGRLRVVNSAFIDNRCEVTGPDLGGAAIRALSQYDNLPVYIAHSTFTGGVCSNGGALSSIGVSWVMLDSVMTDNEAIGWGANPQAPGTPGGGSGGAIYADGDSYTVTVSGSTITRNDAREGGGAIFFVSDNGIGALTIEQSRLHDNPNDGFFTAGYPGIFFHCDGHPIVIGSAIS